MDWMIPEKLKKRVSYARFAANSMDKLETCQTEDGEIALGSSGVSGGFTRKALV